MGADRAKLYADIVYAALSDEARRELKKTMANVDEPKSDWARAWFDEGRKKARVEVIRKQLAARFGTISADVESRISALSEDELDSVMLRILTATTVEQVVAER